ncbi:MAG: DDE-type integrase/transposase/recombinase [Pseudomonadota bacterium]
MGSKNARTYTAEEKRKAIARAMEVGSAQASMELGIPSGTMSSWLFYARRAMEAAEEAKAAPAAARSVPEAEPREAPASEAPAEVPSPSAKRSRVAKVYTPTQIAQALERVAAIGLRPASEELKIARSTLREWKRKAAKAARGEGPSPTSGPEPQEVEARRDAAILAEWRKQAGLGPSQIRNQLRRQGQRVSVQTVRRVMEDAGYLPPKVRRQDHRGSYEAVRPNQLWHMDFVHRHIHRQPVFILALLDDFSRFVTGWALDDAERADAVISCFEAAVRRYGRPEAVMHDGGSAFWAWRGASRFSRLLEEYGVDQYKANNPQTNGKIEVFNGNLHKELLDRVTFPDVGELRRRLGPHFAWYNNHRTHHALGGLLVPADRYHGRADEVLARIETGGAVGDPLELATRTLDLFRVVSHKGRPEIWLMGRKVFEVPE